MEQSPLHPRTLAEKERAARLAKNRQTLQSECAAQRIPFDANHDGVISLEEWKRIYAINGLSEELAERTFPILDGDGDGVLSPEEYLKRIEEFMMVEEGDAPGNHFYGVIE